MSIQNDSQPLAIMSGLDGLPLVSVPVVPTPHVEYIPPDSAEYKADLAVMARAERWIWARALWGQEGMRPDIPDDDLLCDFIPGADVELHLAVDMKAFELIAEDIAAWTAVA